MYKIVGFFLFALLSVQAFAQVENVCPNTVRNYAKSVGSTRFIWTVATGAGAPISNTTSSNLSVTWIEPGTHSVDFFDRDDDTRSFSITVVVSTVVGGTLSSTMTTVCPEKSSTLNLANSSGTVVKWEKSVSGGTWLDIANTTSTHTESNIQANTTFRALLTKCGSTAYSSPLTIAVEKAQPGFLMASRTTYCSGESITVQLTLNDIGGDLRGFFKSEDDGDTWTTAAGNSSNTISVAVGRPTLFKAMVLDDYCGNVFSNIVSITETPGTIAGGIVPPNPTSEVCINESFSLSVNGSNGSVKQWEWRDETHSFSILSSPGDIKINRTHYFRALMEKGSCSSAYTDPLEVKIKPVSIGTLATSKVAICPNESFTLSVPSLEGIKIIWKKSIDNGVTWTTAGETSGATVKSFPYSAQTVNTKWQAIAVNSCNVQELSNIITVNIKQPVGGTINPTPPITCKGEDIALELQNYDGKIDYWESSLNGTTWTTIPHTSAVYPATDMQVTTKFRARVSLCSLQTISSVITLDVIESQPGTLTIDRSTFCSGESVKVKLTLNNYSGLIRRFMKRDSVNGKWGEWETSSSHPSDNTSSVDVSVRTQFKAEVLSDECGNVYSNILEVTETPAPKAGPIVISTPRPEVCVNEPFSLKIVGAIGSVQWHWRDELHTSFSPTSAPIELKLNRSHYFMAKVSNGCQAIATTQPFFVKVHQTPDIINDPAPVSICSGSNVPAFTPLADEALGDGATTFSWTANAPTAISGVPLTGTVFPINHLVTNSSSTVQTITYSITPKNGHCPGNIVTYVVSVKPTPAITANNNSLCGDGPAGIIITNSKGVAGTTGSWNVSSQTNASGATVGEGLAIDQQVSLLDRSTPGEVIYNITPTAEGCSGPTIYSTVTLKPVPQLLNTTWQQRLADGSTVNFVPESSIPGTTYTWAASTSDVVEGLVPTSGTSFPIGHTLQTAPEQTATVTYAITPAYNGCVGETQNLVLMISPFVCGLNYIQTTNFEVAGITEDANVNTLSSESFARSTTFLDGFGRPIQEVQMQNSNAGNDLVQPVVYDSYGRQTLNYLPYVAAESSGWYKSNPVNTPETYTTSDQYKFYNNGAADKVIDDTRPFSETIFEGSPLNRPSQNYGAGEAWGPASNNKYIKNNYLTNVYNTAEVNHEKIISWELGATGMPIRDAARPGYVETGGYYSTGQLIINITRDEQGNEVREYQNKSGQVVLKKVQAVATPGLNNKDHWAATYYVYDKLGNLRFVLPPELTKIVLDNDSYNPTALDLGNWAFQYKYDARKRMTEKTVPGAGTVYMVYDDRDRLVLTQDANQRAGLSGAPKYWSFTKYDEFNRPVLTGIKDTTVTLTQAQMQEVVDSYYRSMATKPWRKYSETFVGALANNVHGYSNNAYPRVTTAGLLDVTKFLTITYYDNYNFKSLWQGDYAYITDGLSELENDILYLQPTSAHEQVIGQTTGTKVKALDGGVTGGYTYLKTVTYYDQKYRVIQTIADNYKDGTDKVSTLYNYAGRVLKTKTTHLEYDITWKDIAGSAAFGNKLTKTAAGSAWGTAGAASREQLPANVDGWIEWTATDKNTYRVIGLSDQNVDANVNTIDYGWYLRSDATLFRYEGGSSVQIPGGYTVGDVFRIERSGTTITYKKNNSEVIITSTVPSSTALLVDVSLYNSGAGVQGIKASFAHSIHTITRRFKYDHSGRLLKTWHQLDSQPEVLLAENNYNELGQLIDKKLHSVNGSVAKQSVDHRYNARGWLTSMNNAKLITDVETNDDTDDYFGFELGYENTLGLAGSAYYNGNIGVMKWSNNLGLASVKEKGYTYTYDPMNRITGASYKINITTWEAATSDGFSESGYAYDLNGNIKSLTRYDERGVTLPLDSLVYDYGAGADASNKLWKVADSGDKYKGFADGTNTGNDYTYDPNGNMVTDQNKSITTDIAYNFLNLPSKISKGGNTVEFIYDATGRKLEQVTTFLNTTKQIDYAGEFHYEDNNLVFVNHEEGRIVMAEEELVYTNDGSTITNLTPLTATAALVTQNGDETYIQVTGDGTTNGGLFPIGGQFPATPGERYKIRVKGYRTSSTAVYIFARTNLGNIQWMNGSWNGSTLASSAESEAWSEEIITIPTGANHFQFGLRWATTTAGSKFFVNDIQIYKLSANTTGEYQYNLKDHLGNVRLTFTTKNEVDSAMATLENSNANSERSEFLFYDEAIKVNHPLVDRTSDGTTAATYNATRLTGGNTNSKFGLAKSLSVMPGDVINIEVYAKYIAPESGTWTQALSDLMAAVAAKSSGTYIDGGTTGSFGSGSYPFEGLVTERPETTGPKAYLNFVVVDKTMDIVLDAGAIRMTDIAKENGSNVAHERLFKNNIRITEPGYVYVFLSNENETEVEVYFDDFKVEHIKSPVIQMDDYYAYGERFNSFSRENSPFNRKLYNAGSELQTYLGLNVYETFYRVYDPTLGRWWQVDPKVDDFYSWTPYNFSYDNPINYNDPLGDCPTCPMSPWEIDAVKDGQMGAGLVESVKGTVTGLWNAVTSPVETVKGIYNAVTNPVETAKAVKNNVVNDFKESPGKALGKTLGGVLQTAVGVGVTKVGSEMSALSKVSKITNPVPDKLARVIPGDIKDVKMLGKTDDVFVTGADDIKGLNSQQIAEKLTISESLSGFKVIEFKTPTGIASPIGRPNPGFVGRGQTAGGAREFVIPNQPLPSDAIIKQVN